MGGSGPAGTVMGVDHLEADLVEPGRMADGAERNRSSSLVAEMKDPPPNPLSSCRAFEMVGQTCLHPCRPISPFQEAADMNATKGPVARTGLSSMWRGGRHIREPAQGMSVKACDGEPVGLAKMHEV